MGGVRKVAHGPNSCAESFGASFKVVAPTVLLLEVPDHCWWQNIGGLLYTNGHICKTREMLEINYCRMLDILLTRD